MTQNQVAYQILDQSKDLFWVVNPELQLVYANSSYLRFMKDITGLEKKLNNPVLEEHFGDGYIERWTKNYNQAFAGAHFETEEHYHHPTSNEIQYRRISFTPLTGDDCKMYAVACQSKDITHLINQQTEASRMVEASLDVFCTINEQGCFVYVSGAASNNWGYLPEELIGKPYMDLILEEDLPKTIAVAAEILSGQEAKLFVNRYKKKRGGIAYNFWSARWDDKDRLMYCVAKDNKEKIEHDEKIFQSEQRFKALVQEGADLIGILDAEGRYMYVSPTSKSILGLAPEELIGRKAMEFIHPDDVEKTAAIIEKVLTTEKKGIIEAHRFQNHKKEWRWLEAVLTNMLDNPAVKGIVVNACDITSKKDEEQNLNLFKSVITHTNDAILITEAEPFDEPGPKIIYVNEAFSRMTGYEAEEIIGKTPRILQGPDSDKEELARLGRAIRNWQPCEATTINYKKSGEKFWLNFTVTPVADEKGWYTHWIAIERDVTEQKTKELEKELLAQISTDFVLENDLLNSATGLCKTVSKFGNFDLVELWTSNFEKNKIHLISHYVADTKDEEFYNYSSKINTYHMSESLVGKVWAGRLEILWNDIENHKDFARRVAAQRIGLKAVMGVPLIFSGEVVGVLKIGTKHNAGYLKRYTQVFQQLKDFVGFELNRKKLENDLSHLFNAIPDILCVADFKGQFLKINKAGGELLGYSEAEILYRHFDEFSHPADRHIFANKLLRLQAEEITLEFENRYLNKRGDIIWLNWYCNSSLKEGLIYATAKNITEEKKLRELNRQAGSLAKIGSWEMDFVHHSIFWTDEVHQLHDTDPTIFEPTLETTINFYREDFRPLVQLHIEKCIATGTPFDFEAVLVTEKKKEVWVRVIGNGEFADGECKRIYGSFQDINDRKEAEVRLHSLADNLPGVVYQHLIYPDGTDSFKFVSKGSQQVWGFAAEEVIKNHQLVWNGIIAGGEIDKFRKSMADSIASKTKWTARWKYVMPDGEIKIHLAYGSPNFLADGTVLFNAVILDATQEAKNEERLEEVINLSRIGSWEVNLVNNKFYWSSMVHNIMETDPEQHGRKIENSFNFYREDFREMAKYKFTACAEKGISFDYEAVMITGNKTEKWVRVIGSAGLVDGKPTRIYGSLQDIHDLKKEEAEKISLQTTLENSLNEIYMFDAETYLFSYVNRGALLNIGYSESEMKALTPLDIKPDFTAASFKELVTPLIKNEKEKLVFFTNHQRKNGTLYPAEIHLQLVTESNNKRFVAIILDITVRKKAEESILQANERFEKVTEATNDAIWDWDIVNQTYYRSKAIERFFGKGVVKSLQEKDFWKDKFHPDDISEIQNSIHEAISTPSCNRWELEYRVLNEQGKIIYLIDRGVIIRNKEGKAIRMVGAMTDISEQKNMTLQLSQLNKTLQLQAAELKRSNEELEQFAFVASHDLQEPLRMISSFMDLLQRKYGDRLDEKGIRYIHFATDGAKRMKQIILDLLEYSRANRPTEGTEEVDINELISEFKLLRRKIISEKDALIKKKSLPTLKIYKIAVTQIFHCLLDNAMKYTEAGTRPIIEITAVENESEWEFSIKDNGIGIAPEFYDKIFIIFQRLHNKEQYGGTGIGLSIAKRHVEFLGGRIWLVSTQGEGSTFYFTIPKIK